MTFEKYLLEKGLSKGTASTYQRNILLFLTWLDMENLETEQVSSADIMAYMNHLQKKEYANTTRGIHLLVIRTFYDYQIHFDKQQINPAQYIKIRGIKRIHLYPLLSKSELENIYQNYEVPTDNHPMANRNWFRYYQLSRQRNKTILGLMVWQGLGTAEINQLKLVDVKLREGLIYIAGRRKGQERTLELKPQQIIELMEYQVHTRQQLLAYYKENPEQKVFYLTTPAVGKKTAKNSTNDALNLWKRLNDDVRKANPKFIHFKQVRACVITAWLGQYNLRQVQYMAGHRYVSTTQRYMLNQVEDLQNDIEQFHPIG